MENLTQRKARNDDLIERMLNGEKLSYMDASATWFPPRPMACRVFKRATVLEQGDQHSSDGVTSLDDYKKSKSS
jgi:hypothetical protein